MKASSHTVTRSHTHHHYLVYLTTHYCSPWTQSGVQNSLSKMLMLKYVRCLCYWLWRFQFFFYLLEPQFLWPDSMVLLTNYTFQKNYSEAPLKTNLVWCVSFHLWYSLQACHVENSHGNTVKKSYLCYLSRIILHKNLVLHYLSKRFQLYSSHIHFQYSTHLGDAQLPFWGILSPHQLSPLNNLPITNTLH